LGSFSSVRQLVLRGGQGGTAIEGQSITRHRSVIDRPPSSSGSTCNWTDTGCPLDTREHGGEAVTLGWRSDHAAGTHVWPQSPRDAPRQARARSITGLVGTLTAKQGHGLRQQAAAVPLAALPNTLSSRPIRFAGASV
jgi:hypothetical protein